MQIDRRITNGLAWAGVLLVVGVPTADLLSAQFMGDTAKAPAAQVAVVDTRRVAPVPVARSQRPAPIAVAEAAPPVTRPAAQAAVASADPVGDFVQSGKPLPSYITEAPTRVAVAKPAPAAALAVPAPVAAPAKVAAAPAAVARPPVAVAATPAAAPGASGTAPVAIDPVQTASIPARIAPTPMPLSMRPRAVAVATAAQMPPAIVFPVNEPVFVPPSVQPVPPADITAQDLEDWETGPLADFLARRQGRQAPQQAEAAPRSGSEEEYFFEGGRQFPPRDRLVGPETFFYQFGY